MIVRPLSTVDNTRDCARVSHGRQWSNYNLYNSSLVWQTDRQTRQIQTRQIQTDRQTDRRYLYMVN